MKTIPSASSLLYSSTASLTSRSNIKSGIKTNIFIPYTYKHTLIHIQVVCIYVWTYKCMHANNTHMHTTPYACINIYTNTLHTHVQYKQIDTPTHPHTTLHTNIHVHNACSHTQTHTYSHYTICTHTHFLVSLLRSCSLYLHHTEV